MTVKHIFVGQIIALTLSCQLLAMSLDKTVLTDEGVSFHLPQDWERVPNEVLRQYTEALREAAPGVDVQVYNYAFQKMPSETWLSYPYVLVQIKKTGRMPESELKKYRAIDAGIAKGVQELKEQAQSLLSDIRTGETVYDASTHTLWMTMQSKVVEVGDIDAIVGVRLTEFGAVQIMGYSKHADFAEQRPILEAIINSVEMNDQISYKPRFSDSVPRVFGIDLVRVGRSAVIGALVGGLGSLIVALAKRRMRKSQPPSAN